MQQDISSIPQCAKGITLPSVHKAFLELTAFTAKIAQAPVNQANRDMIIRDVNVLRQNPTVSQAVAQLVAAYQKQAIVDSTQGRHLLTKKSGQYNTTDIQGMEESISLMTSLYPRR